MRFGMIRRPAYEPLAVPELDWFNRLLNGGLRPAAYLLSGEPGSNKTTIVVLLAGKLAEAGIKVLLVLTEQTPYEVEKVFARVYGGRECVPNIVWENVEYELVENRRGAVGPQLGGGLSGVGTSSGEQHQVTVVDAALLSIEEVPEARSTGDLGTPGRTKKPRGNTVSLLAAEANTADAAATGGGRHRNQRGGEILHGGVRPPTSSGCGPS